MTRLGDIPEIATLDVDLEPGDIVTGSVVLIRVSGLDGSTSVSKHHGPGTDWITAMGLLAAAAAIDGMSRWSDE